MKKLLGMALLTLLMIPGIAQAERHRGHDDCRFIATAFNDGTGDYRSKKQGGNYISIDLDSLKEDDIVKVTPTSGTLRYVTLHARYKGGYWDTIYTGPITVFPVKQYLGKYKKDPNCTHVNISVNGAHERFDPMACQADITVCDSRRDQRPVFDNRHRDEFRDCIKNGSVYNDGRGDNRTKKRGGNYASIDIRDLKDGQILKIVPTSGNYRYITLHARYKGGYWNIIYQGPNTEFPVAEYFAKFRKDPGFTHVNVSVNGAHERYEPVACNVDFYICGKAVSPHASPWNHRRPPYKERKVALKALAGQHVCADGGGGKGLTANRSRIKEWETFTMVMMPGDKVAFRARKGQYVRVMETNWKHLNAVSSSIGERETFTMVQRPGGNVAFKAFNGKYVCAEGGGGPLYANRDAASTWETFTLIYLD